MRAAHVAEERNSDVAGSGSRDLEGDVLVVGPVCICDVEFWSCSVGDEVGG